MKNDMSSRLMRIAEKVVCSELLQQAEEMVLHIYPTSLQHPPAVFVKRNGRE